MRVKKECCNLETLKKFGNFENGFCGVEGLFCLEIEEYSILLINANENGHCRMEECDIDYCIESENEIEFYYEIYEEYKDNHEHVCGWRIIEKVVCFFNRMKEAGIIESERTK